MNYKLNLVLSILIVIAFMQIRISYNGGSSVSILFTTLKLSETILNNGLEFRWNKSGLNFSIRVIEILIISTALILTAILNRIKLNTIFAIIFSLYTILISILYSSLIDLNLFFITSIPFYLLSVILILKNIVSISSKSR
jgi:hypothetical protein